MSRRPRRQPSRRSSLYTFLALSLIFVALAVIVAALATSALKEKSSDGQTTATVQVETAQQALDQLARLEVKPPDTSSKYVRDKFGTPWKDVDHNGCDTRNDVLKRDLADVAFQSGSTCVIVKGTLTDPYTGKVIAFIRGQGTSDDVQIDHVIALGDAWQTGAFAWSDDKRLQLANDPLELIAVDGPTNASKGDKDAASWLPPNAGFRCRYAILQVAVKVKYQLWVTQPEHDALNSTLAACPSGS
jgi:hypothetical protein